MLRKFTILGMVAMSGMLIGRQARADGPNSASVDQAWMNYHQDQSNLLSAQERARMERLAQPDVLTAHRDLHEAVDTMDAAKQNVLTALANREDYQAAVAQRDAAAAAVESVDQASPRMYALALKKMQTAAVVSRMEAAAMSADPIVQAARQELATAVDAVTTENAQAYADIANDPDVMAARNEIQNARGNLASAQADFDAQEQAALQQEHQGQVDAEAANAAQFVPQGQDTVLSDGDSYNGGWGWNGSPTIIVVRPTHRGQSSHTSGHGSSPHVSNPTPASHPSGGGGGGHRR